MFAFVPVLDGPCAGRSLSIKTNQHNKQSDYDWMLRELYDAFYDEYLCFEKKTAEKIACPLAQEKEL